MRKVAKFGHVWEHIPSGTITGTSIEVNTVIGLKEYKEVKKGKEVIPNLDYKIKKRGVINE